ncbi:MAG TPA: peptidyl-prolyl cis-trans isomerase [Burkholderiales bacterium]|nr:peptidyl-prolyl cis-trans isomerase [Burkholderiales bacterium]
MTVTQRLHRFAKPLVLFCVLLPLSLGANGQDNDKSDKPIVTVNGVAIKQSLLEMAVKQAVAQGNVDTPQLREVIKNQLIARELFLQEGMKQNLDKDPQVLQVVEEAKRTAVVQKYLQTQVKIKQVTEEEAKAQYEQTKANLGPKEYKLRVIMLPTEQRAKEIKDQLNKGKDFADLARQWSQAPSSSRGGEIEWVSFKSPAKEGQTQGLPLPMAQTVEKLQKGKVSDPIQANGQWWLVMLEDTRPTRVPTFEQAKPNLMRAMQQHEIERATSELASKLAKSAKISQ